MPLLAGRHDVWVSWRLDVSVSGCHGVLVSRGQMSMRLSVWCPGILTCGLHTIVYSGVVLVSRHLDVMLSGLPVLVSWPCSLGVWMSCCLACICLCTKLHGQCA